MSRQVVVRVPATTANLGPGFDCLGLALDLWNEAVVTLCGSGIHVEIEGHGKGRVAEDERNLVAQGLLRFYETVGRPVPVGVLIRCKNNIPLGSGMGSSAAAVLAGLFAGNALLGSPCTQEEVLSLAAQMEGHPDNVAAAVLGGLVIVINDDGHLIMRRFDPAPWQTAVVVPNLYLPTSAARAAIPQQVALKDAVYNLGRTALVIEALRTGDTTLLAQSMHDSIHQPYRLKLIPGGQAALDAALNTGATAAALSGAGPGLIAFSMEAPGKILEAMMRALSAAGLTGLALGLNVTPLGAQVQVKNESQNPCA
jgi:homoserine kinase